jgi:hypothetical protein
MMYGDEKLTTVFAHIGDGPPIQAQPPDIAREYSRAWAAATNKSLGPPARCAVLPVSGQLAGVEA